MISLASTRKMLKTTNCNFWWSLVVKNCLIRFGRIRYYFYKRRITKIIKCAIRYVITFVIPRIPKKRRIRPCLLQMELDVMKVVIHIHEKRYIPI